MTQKFFRYALAMCVVLGVSATLTGCIDDDLTGNHEADTEDYAIAFDISLDAGNATRANGDKMEVGDPIDSEVDIAGTNHDFRILFFDTNDKFLFEPAQKSEYYIAAADNYNYGYTTDDDNNNSNAPSTVQTNRWRVKIPISVLREKGVLETMENEGFKIAVLANWPKNPLEFNIGDPISKLSHYHDDDTYTKSYSYLTSDANAAAGWGAYVNWVKNSQNNAAAAENFIRNENYEGAPFDYTKPEELIEGESISAYSYKHIWRIWNFRTGNEDIDSKVDEDYLYYKGSESHRKKWKEINAKWCEQLESATLTSRFYYGSTYNEAGNSVEKTDYALDFQTEDDKMGYVGKQYLKLPNVISSTTDVSTSLYDNNKTALENVLHFKAFADGTLYITAKTGSGSAGKDIVVGVQIDASDTGSNNKGKANRTKNQIHLGNTSDNDQGIRREGFDVVVEHKPVDIYIYSISGNAQIHEIEFIENTYLYDTDRRGRYPEEKGYLIPMYGIQKYDSIGNYLVSGQTLDLSLARHNDSDYNGQKLYLLRSIAKVELFIPENWNPSHIIMRSMNRTNRCEPVDVSTPTNELWKKVDDEIEKIKSKGVFYNNNATTAENKMKWFYGVWPENNNTDTTCPHIYNCRIQRTDYAYMLKTELQPKTGYTRYVLYMPEKNIDDPTSVGKWEGTPKVPHIELRFNNINDDQNLEDNDCYRIYFADTQQYKTVPEDRNAPSVYEKNLNNTHYPIMRNHIYRFTLSGDLDKFAEKSDIEVTFDVIPYGECWLDPEFGLKTNNE